jgi:hypothetical protein
MRKKRHPLSGAVYEERDDGLVLVTRGEESGVFRADGTWVEGSLRQADAHLCLWVGGRGLKSRRPAAVAAGEGEQP